MPLVLGSAAPDTWEWHLSSGTDDFYFGCQPDRNGVHAVIARPDGWDSPEIRIDETDIPLDWGADVGPVLYGKRILVLTGTIAAPDLSTLELARRKFLAAYRALTVDGLFEGIDDDGIRRYCRVRRSGKPTITRVDLAVYQFTAQLTAGDPRKYSTLSAAVQVNPGVHTGGGFIRPYARPFTASGPLSHDTQALRNNGDLPTPLNVSFAGPLDSPLLVETTGTGLRVNLNSFIPDNKVAVLDPRGPSLLLDDTSLDSSLRSDSTPIELLQIPAGRTTQWRMVAGGAGHALLTAADAWE